ncbi:MAG: aspartate kinase [Desulfotomaculaceae bacterium]|nr:aspartate kinase [Desulfotomaculaceae bacterium]
MLVVQKYGGSSVANAERIRRVARRVANVRAEGNSIVIVVSAMGDTTDDLINLVKEITSSPPEREMDMILSTGEQVSIALLAMAIKELGVPAISLNGIQVGIMTDNAHTRARILDVSTTRLKKELDRGNIVIVAGFQGIDESNDITTLGRGGSDTTAVALAVALKADLCEIYTDVDGVYTADPRIEPNAKKLDLVSYNEMLELANLGAVVLHPRSVELAMQYGIPLHVRSSFNHNLGTIVREVSSMEKTLVVTGVAYDLNVAKIGLYDVFDKPGIAYKLFKSLANEKINVDMIIQSATRNERNDISFTCSRNDLTKALSVVQKLLPEIGASGVTSNDNVAKVSIVGAGMVSNPGVAATMFGVLAEEGINLEMISTSEIKTSCVIEAGKAEKAVRVLHDKFNLAK